MSTSQTLILANPPTPPHPPKKKKKKKKQFSVPFRRVLFFFKEEKKNGNLRHNISLIRKLCVCRLMTIFRPKKKKIEKTDCTPPPPYLKEFLRRQVASKHKLWRNPSAKKKRKFCLSF
jgi:hypothetical protein